MPGVPEILVETPRQWSGSPVSLRSRAFITGTSVKVTIAGDTLDTDPGGSPDIRRFVVPPLITTTYELHVLVDGYAVPISLDVVGVAREPVPFAGGCCASTVTNVQGSGTGEVYFADEGDFGEPATRGAYCVVNLPAPSAGKAVPGLFADEVDRIQLSVPGPSYRVGHLVFDLAHDLSPDRMARSDMA